MPLCNWHTFWMAPGLIVFLLSYFLYWEKVTSYAKFSHNLTIEVQIVPKISDRFLIELKNCKTLYEVQTASRLKEIYQHHPKPTPHQIKSYYFSGANILFGDIQRYTGIFFQSVAKLQFLGFKKWCSANVISYAK